MDDEAGIRMTLAPILERHDFQVTTAATVPEALEKINHETFDVLLSDLNIGQPGDGFTVVSAMRRVQPDACTFILTGYPDFETALQAIRSQVDDYLLKPTDVPTLIRAIQRKLESRRPQIPEAPVKRVSELLRENIQHITQEWLKEVRSHHELTALRLHDDDRIDHIPPLVEQLALRIETGQSSTSKRLAELGQKHGEDRPARVIPFHWS